MNFLNDQSLIFQLTHHILISIPIPSINLFFQLTHQFNRISSPTPSSNLESAQPDLNPNPINQGPADVSNDNSIGTPCNNLPLRKSTNVFENGPKKKRAKTQVEKSERNAKKYPVLPPCKEPCSKSCITNFSSDDRALINSRFWKLSFTERRQWLAAYINQVDAKNKTSQQKDGGRLSSREYLLPLKDSKNVIVCKSMLLMTLIIVSNQME